MSPATQKRNVMDNAVRKLFTVTKEDYLKDEAQRIRARNRKRVKAKKSV